MGFKKGIFLNICNGRGAIEGSLIGHGDTRHWRRESGSSAVMTSVILGFPVWSLLSTQHKHHHRALSRVK